MLHLIMVLLLLNLAFAKKAQPVEDFEVEFTELPEDFWDPPPPPLDPTPTDDLPTDLPSLANTIESLREPPPAPPEIDEPVPPDTQDGLDEILPSPASPLLFRTPIGTRVGGNREKNLQTYSHGLGAKTEPAVQRALEWLRINQQADGSWGDDNRNAMTGLALLTFLAHGETTDSPRYGACVEKGIRHLVAQQDATGRFGKNVYVHSIATYAISEAYSMTRIAALKPVMEKAIAVIIQGQQSKGGWDYDYGNKGRRDTSIAGWQIQALKAAKIAQAEVPGLEEALAKALGDLKSAQHRENGRFFYSDPTGAGSLSMTGVSVLCLQLLGEGESPEARDGLQALQEMDCNWRKAPEWALYTWYYTTQARFHAGKGWESWNARFARTLVAHQNEDGSWPAPGNEKNHGPVYSTTLAALMLQVYYRQLPTFKTIPAISATCPDQEDVGVTIL